MRSIRRTWLLGGIVLVVCGVIEVLRYPLMPAGEVVQVVKDVLFAVAIVLFAVGLSRDASVVARRPLGVVALAIVALWPLLGHVVRPLLPVMNNTTFEAGLDAYRHAEGVLTAFWVVSATVLLAVSLVAAGQIADARTVPSPWRWAPMWSLIVVIAMGMLPLALYSLVGPGNTQAVAPLVLSASQLGSLTPTLGLGIVALVLAGRPRPRSIDVFRSTSSPTS